MNKFSWLSKWLLVVFLLVVASGLWIRILFFSTEEVAVEEVKTRTEKKPSRGQKQESAEVTREDIEREYNPRQTNRMSPFVVAEKNEAEFKYESNQDTANLKLAEVSPDLKLIGILKQNNRFAVLVKQQAETSYLKVGDEIAGFKLEEITADRVFFSHGKQNYFSIIETR
jgi:cytoskeletal protein RodZ